MSENILQWPLDILVPASIEPNVVPFSRSGGTTLGGLQRVTRTDRGWWSIAYKGVSLYDASRRRMWSAVRNHCSGMVGLLAVPVWSMDSAPWPAGSWDGRVSVVHDDASPHSDGAPYVQPAIGVELVSAATIGDTSVTLRAVHGIEDLTGIRWSYQHALYETGFSTAVDGDQWTVPIAPAIRAPIPAGAALEAALPTCLVRLASDREMDSGLSAGLYDRGDVAFVEAVDYWNDLAAAG